MRYIFYDTETTGIDTTFGQILQFAAICTDEQFNVLDRLEIRSRLLPYVVASAGACRVNGVTIEQLNDPALPSHYGMVRVILETLHSWGPAVFIGYNSIRFDENIFRQALYQTLHQPYFTNTGGNSRSDALKIVQAVHLHRPDVLAFPINEKGLPTFKLDRLAPANGFSGHKAHDALGDVEATIFLCRLIAERAPQLWSTFMRFSRKAAIDAFLTREPAWCLTEYYGARPYCWLVTTLGRNPDNPSELCVVDLSIDPTEFSALDDVALAVRLSKSPKPVRWVKTNASPIVSSANAVPAIAAASALDASELTRRQQRYRDDKLLAERMITALVSNREIYPPSQFVEQMIYDGFFSNEDQERMSQFHETPWDRRIDIVAQFDDSRLRDIGLRLIYVERPEALPEGIRREQASSIADRLLGATTDCPWLTIPNAIIETDAMLVQADDASRLFLQSYRDYLVRRMASF